MIVLQNDDACAAPDCQDFCGAGNTVADRGYQRDVIGIGPDQPCRRRSRAFVLLLRERGVDCPGRALAPDRGAAGFQRSQRQRTVGG